MTKEIKKEYTRKQVEEIMSFYQKRIDDLRIFKSDIKQLVDSYVSSNTSDENVYKQLERLCINHMLEQNDKWEQNNINKN